MVITTDAKNRIRDLLRADISSAALGTGGTSATSSDTDLETVIESTRKSPTISTSNKTITIQHELLSTEGNGNTFREGGIFIDSDGILLDRFVYPDFDKTAANELVTIDVIKID